MIFIFNLIAKPWESVLIDSLVEVEQEFPIAPVLAKYFVMLYLFVLCLS